MSTAFCHKCGRGWDIEDIDPVFPYDWDNYLCFSCSVDYDAEDDEEEE